MAPALKAKRRIDSDSEESQPPQPKRNKHSSGSNHRETAKKKKESSVARPRKQRGKQGRKKTHKPRPQLWVVESILDDRVRDGQVEYLVKWLGTDPETNDSWEDSWEPEYCLSDCAEALAAYQSDRQAAAGAETADGDTGPAPSGPVETEVSVSFSGPGSNSSQTASSEAHAVASPASGEAGYYVSSFTALNRPSVKVWVPGRVVAGATEEHDTATRTSVQRDPPSHSERSSQALAPVSTQVNLPELRVIPDSQDNDLSLTNGNHASAFQSTGTEEFPTPPESPFGSNAAQGAPGSLRLQTHLSPTSSPTTDSSLGPFQSQVPYTGSEEASTNHSLERSKDQTASLKTIRKRKASADQEKGPYTKSSKRAKLPQLTASEISSTYPTNTQEGRATSTGELQGEASNHSTFPPPSRSSLLGYLLSPRQRASGSAESDSISRTIISTAGTMSADEDMRAEVDKAFEGLCSPFRASNESERRSGSEPEAGQDSTVMNSSAVPATSGSAKKRGHLEGNSSSEQSAISANPKRARLTPNPSSPISAAGAPGFAPSASTELVPESTVGGRQPSDAATTQNTGESAPYSQQVTSSAQNETTSQDAELFTQPNLTLSPVPATTLPQFNQTNKPSESAPLSSNRDQPTTALTGTLPEPKTTPLSSQHQQVPQSEPNSARESVKQMQQTETALKKKLEELQLRYDQLKHDYKELIKDRTTLRQDLDDRQGTYEKRGDELRKLHSQVREREEKLEGKERYIANKEKQMADLRTENKKLKEENADLLKNNANPEFRENVELKKKADDLEKRLERERKDTEYVNEQYQRASAAASERAAEATSHEERIKELEEQAESNRVQLRQAFNDDRAKHFEEELARECVNHKATRQHARSMEKKNEVLEKELDEIKKKVGMGLSTRRAASPLPSTATSGIGSSASGVEGRASGGHKASKLGKQIQQNDRD